VRPGPVRQLPRPSADGKTPGHPDRYLSPVDPSLVLLREALRNLSLEPEGQRQVLAGTVVPDELALDSDNAVQALPRDVELAGVTFDKEVQASLERLTAMLDAGPDDGLWADQALDIHPAWAEARSLARRLLILLPGGEQPTHGPAVVVD